PKAVRASMGSVFACPPARGAATGTTVALDADAPDVLEPVDGPVTLLVGAEREGLPADVVESAHVRARIPLRPGGPESLNAAMAATLALYVMSSRNG
ncbi:MAG TPA: TrmH family RNA methyltransferase, partial [Thermoleophilaceae bacterium]|nr:TrmH family RNA methyltransferase [Thermoleophilaceae bacterium]